MDLQELEQDTWLMHCGFSPEQRTSIYAQLQAIADRHPHVSYLELLSGVVGAFRRNPRVPAKLLIFTGSLLRDTSGDARASTEYAITP